MVLDQPTTLPDGSRVELVPVDSTDRTCGMREEDWPTTPEEIAAHVARMDSVEPGWLSPEDEADWRANLQAQKEFEKARFFEHAEKLRKMWD